MVTMINVPIVNQSLPKAASVFLKLSFWFSVVDLAVLIYSKLQDQDILSYHTESYFHILCKMNISAFCEFVQSEYCLRIIHFSPFLPLASERQELNQEFLSKNKHTREYVPDFTN